jgi:V/A-type H+-transporting ATPase subunit I
MQVVNKWRQNGFTASLQPAGTFLLIVGVAIWAVGNMGRAFSVGPIPVGTWINALGNTAGLGLGMAALGILLVLFFNNPGKKIWIRPLLGLWEMYGIASGVPGDILSYIRLFALSLAGGLLGGAINLIANMIRGENPGVFSWIFMLLVLIGGHFINFALAALGAFVHPLRLTFVEFYKSVGFTGGGKPYSPYGGKTT